MRILNYWQTDMNRFRKYNLLKEFNGVRLTHKAIPDPDVGYSMPQAHIYRVQSHRRFLGISYWKTLIKTTSYKIANDAYDLMTYDGKIGF